MARTITAKFSTRRDAELAVEHLVQEYGIDRADIFLVAPEAGNSAGSRAAGADVESGHPHFEKDGNPALAGDIELSVDLNDDREATIRRALDEVGATGLSTD